MSIGFVVVRHVNNTTTNEYWKRCYLQIRKFHGNSPILIVDDNSDAKFIQNDNFPVENCIVVEGEFPKRAELLGLYYFHKLHPFEKAVIIHDSAFLNSTIDVDRVDEVIFLWSFTHEWDNDEQIFTLMSRLKESDTFIEFYKDKSQWHGCLGVMCIISWNFLDMVDRECAFFDALLPQIDSRAKRMCLERVFAVVCTYFHRSLTTFPHYINDIHVSFPRCLSFDSYLRGEASDQMIIKVWTGR